LYLAGIWDEWGQGRARKRSFAIITTTPNREMSELHDRMPVILTDETARALWLSEQPLDNVLSLLHPPADGFLKMYRVTEKLNHPDYQGEDLHDPVAEEWSLF
jgi:putative SOS response-associated peptidase YedK